MKAIKGENIQSCEHCSQALYLHKEGMFFNESLKKLLVYCRVESCRLHIKDSCI